MWRSLVAYTAGGRVVAGSNPVIPTKQKSDLQLQITFLPACFPKSGKLVGRCKKTLFFWINTEPNFYILFLSY